MEEIGGNQGRSEIFLSIIESQGGFLPVVDNGFALYKGERMQTIIQMSEVEEAKALSILLRHFVSTVLPNRIYIVSADAAKKLREAGVQFTELSHGSNAPCLEGVGSGERI